MRIEVGKAICIKNRKTAETFYLEVSDMFDRDGADIAYGTALPHGIYVPATRGRVHVKSRPACLVVVPGELDEIIERLVDELRGLPWYWVPNPKAQIGKPILNMRLVKYFGPQGMTKDAMIERAVKLLDLYRQWKRGGLLPPEFLQARDRVAAERNAATQPGPHLLTPPGQTISYPKESPWAGEDLGPAGQVPPESPSG